MFKPDRSAAICTAALPDCLNYGTLTPVTRRADLAQRSPAPDLHSLVMAIDQQNPAHKPARLVLYIHGYNNGFAQAYTSASTFLAYATPAPSTSPAPVVFYSWPANGKAVKYLDDETNNTWSAVHFRTVLQGLLADPDAPPQIDVVAHSMGNRLLMDALVYLQESRAQTAPIGRPSSCVVGSGDASDANRKDPSGQFVCHHIGQVVSFEPDVDSATFFEGSEHAETIAEGFTLYGSRADYALELSRELHGHCRAGQLFCDLALPLAKNVNIIDASIFRCDFFGHSYWDASPTVEHDLGVLLSSPTVMSNDPPGAPRTPAVMEYVAQGVDRSISLAHYRFKAHQPGDDACGAGP
jgi:esterase/lipase superfamily enzyme